MKRRGELSLILRAIKQGWDVCESERIRSITFVLEVMQDPEATPREILAACRVVLAAEEANLQIEIEKANTIEIG